jgi:selenocysteine-specific elongation factor
MFVIATAGHVDHGKSTLVRALTGMEPDRWAEEKRRGMTIDLGYAWTTLDDDTQVAFVDVPGHQRFISNMLAGVGPVPAVLLVVASDEGWSRQTVEHVAALDALGVRHGVLAATRSDLGDADLAIAEARDRLAGTSLEDIEAVAVSPVAGVGLDDLRTALLRLTKRMPPTYTPATRLWIDRVFTIRGVGTVVTGTLASGRISVGDELLVASSGEAVRVRGLETLKSSVPSVEAVSRVAVNLRGTKADELVRGDALIGRDWWANFGTVDVRLVNPPQRPPTELVLHIGSAAVAARVRPLGNDTARLSLRSPLPLHVGERAILRDPGEQHVVTGVIVLDTMPPDLGRRGAAARRAAELDVMTGEPDPAREVHRRRAVRRDRLVAAGVLDPNAGTPAGAVHAGAWLIADDQWRAWRAEIGAVLDEWSSAHPMSPGMPSPAVTRRLGLPDQELVALLVSSVDDVTLDGDGVHRLGVVPTLPPGAEAGLSALLDRLADEPFDAATGPELASAGLTDAHLSTAVRNGRLLRVAPGVFLAPNAVDEAARRLAALPQPFTMSKAREALATTRRVSVPLLELLDRRRITVRVDDQRRAIGG